MTTTTPAPLVTGVAPEDQRAVETLYAAFQGNPHLLDEAVVPDWEDIPLAPHQAPGRDGMKPLIGEFNAAFPDLKITIREMIGVPGKVAVRALITGTHKGDWFGVPATGKRFEMAIHEFHYVTAGKVTHTWHLEDWFGWFFQVGAWPNK
ncbi:ester cyclase [Metarhizobium album]|uniref:Ester cyclase n=1 Tax=Metarhizobium album TaxID=2182425 RepID=A0A2U2DJD7_9HYPH|nr:ester cyclase [Rhizobium album]PWE53413.1 ester cyclase [Rhizobium album]